MSLAYFLHGVAFPFLLAYFFSLALFFCFLIFLLLAYFFSFLSYCMLKHWMNEVISFTWQTLVASVMDSSTVRWLENDHLMKMEMTMHSLQNIWATEVYHTDPITEARNMIQELLER